LLLGVGGIKQSGCLCTYVLESVCECVFHLCISWRNWDILLKLITFTHHQVHIIWHWWHFEGHWFRGQG